MIDWSPTVGQKVGAVVGFAIGASSWVDDDLPLWTKVAFPVVYAVACAVILRMRGVVRHRRSGQFSAHQVAMAVIVVGWLVNDDASGALVNGAWLASAARWWVLEGRRAA